MNRSSGPPVLKDTYRRTMDRIAEAAARRDRRPDSVLCVAVTKNASPEQIRMLVEMGHSDLGESRVHQLVQRVARLEESLSRRRTLASVVPRSETGPPAAVRWHLVGHLQRNKVKIVLPLVKLIHGVDSLRLAEEIHTIAGRSDTTVDVLLQVNTSGEQSKFGVAAPAALHLAEQIDTMHHLRIRGLMTMAPASENPEDARPTFARAYDIFQEIRAAGFCGDQFNILSMGMSADFEIAIEEGANVVRIGRALFGEAESPSA